MEKNLQTIIAIIGIPLTIIGVFLTVCTLYNVYSHGQGECIPPSEFALLRGHHGPFNSDLLLVPINWRNNGARDELIENLTLNMTLAQEEEKAVASNEIINKKWFLLGTIKAISEPPSENDTPYIFQQDLIIEPHSITQIYCVFQIEDWWNNSNAENFNFKFNHTMNLWSVGLNFIVDGVPGHGKLFDLPIYETVDKMKARSNYSWDVFQIDAPEKIDPIKWRASLPIWQQVLILFMDLIMNYILILLAYYFIFVFIVSIYVFFIDPSTIRVARGKVRRKVNQIMNYLR